MDNILHFTNTLLLFILLSVLNASNLKICCSVWFVRRNCSIPQYFFFFFFTLDCVKAPTNSTVANDNDLKWHKMVGWGGCKQNSKHLRYTPPNMRATIHTFTSFIVRKRVVATALSTTYDGIWIFTKAEITGHLLTWDIALQMLVFA